MNVLAATGELLSRAPRPSAPRQPTAGVLRAAATPQPASQSATATSPPANTLRIERLVLDGPALDPLQAGQLRAALEQELAELLEREPLPPTSRHQDRLRGPPLRADAAGPAGLGLAIARCLHAGLAGTGDRPE